MILLVTEFLQNLAFLLNFSAKLVTFHHRIGCAVVMCTCNSHFGPARVL